MLAYDDSGAGTPVVLLHGLGSSRRRWDPIVDDLAGEVRCIAVDLPGHGDSSDEGCDAVSALRAVDAVVVALGLRRPVVVGHSMGAIVALLYAATRPTRSAVAVDPLGLHAPTFAAKLAPYRHALLGGDTLSAFREFEEEHLLTGAQSAESIRAGLSPRAKVIRSYWRDLLDDPELVAARQPRFAAALASITVSTLVLLADPPADEDAVVLAGVRAATVEVWSGSSHWLHLEDPERFGRRLRIWIAEHDR